MTAELSPNAKAILLLTAPLIVDREQPSQELLSPGLYNELARHLIKLQKQPADLIAPDAAELRRACQPIVDAGRLERLLGRGFLLSQVFERWQARAIWVMSRADQEYPRRLRARLGDQAPTIIYGCGDRTLLERGGLAVVGSRHADQDSLDHATSVGQLAASAQKTVVSGGAKGVDSAAMNGALNAGGTAIGVLGDSLQAAAMNREHRKMLLEGRLVLISPFDPSIGFQRWRAMQRNKLVYALADASLVVRSDQKGGTWEGAVEQLKKYKSVPVFVRASGNRSPALNALRKMGALPWPEPRSVQELDSILSSEPIARAASQPELNLFTQKTQNVGATPKGTQTELASTLEAETHSFAVTGAESPAANDAEVFPEAPKVSEPSGASLAAEQEPSRGGEDAEGQETRASAAQAAIANMTPAERIFELARQLMVQELQKPMKDSDVAAVLGVEKLQAKAWLQRLVKEGVLEKRSRPVVYVVNREGLRKQEEMFEPSSSKET